MLLDQHQNTPFLSQATTRNWIKKRIANAGKKRPPVGHQMSLRNCSRKYQLHTHPVPPSEPPLVPKLSILDQASASQQTPMIITRSPEVGILAAVS
jgi:hypothetical protein